MREVKILLLVAGVLFALGRTRMETAIAGEPEKAVTRDAISGTWNLVAVSGKSLDTLHIKSHEIELAADGTWSCVTQFGGPLAGLKTEISGKWSLEKDTLSYTAGGKAGKSKAKFVAGRLLLDPDFILRKDGKTPVVVEYRRSGEKDDDKEPEHVSEATRKGWENQGFVSGWIRFAEGGFMDFHALGQGKSGDLPSFLLVTPFSGVFAKLPQPDRDFGIVVFPRGKEFKPDADDLKPLGGMKRLVMLSLNNARIPDAGLKGLAAAKELRQLYLVKTNLTDAALAALTDLRGLRSLSLNNNAELTNACLKNVGQLKELRLLSVGHTQVTNVKELAGLEHLETLFLSGTRVADANLDDLARLKKLNALFLSGSQVTDAGIKKLSPLKQLQVLALNATSITDEGLRDLAGLKQLKKLSLRDTKVTEAGLEKLQTALPELKIEH